MSEFEGNPIQHYEALFNKYAGYVRSTYEKRTTQDRWIHGAKKYLNWCGEAGFDPTEASQDVVHDYLTSTQGLADGSRVSAYMAVLMMYEWWMRGASGIDAEHNPCADIDLKKDHQIKRGRSRYAKVLARKNKSDLKALSKGAVESLFPYADESGARTELRNTILLRLMWDTACRSDEVSRMRVDAIDWDDQYIDIVSSKLKPDQELYERRVFFSATTKRLLEMWVNGGREALSSTYAGSEYLFMTTHKPQMRPGGISRIVKDAAFRHDDDEQTDDDIQLKMYEDAAGRSRWLVTGHRIRHSRISYLCNHTSMNLNNIRMLAGHEQLQTTMDYVTTDWDTVQSDYHAAID